MFTSSQIRQVPVAELRPRPNNARTHSAKQIRKIAESIRKFGFISPVIVDEQGYIVAGHGRIEGAKLAGVEKVPVITVTHLSPEEVRAYVLADNKARDACRMGSRIAVDRNRRIFWTGTRARSDRHRV